MKAIIRDTKRRLYCGPTAICAVTGVAASIVLAIIESRRGEAAYKTSGQLKGVRGMFHGEVQHTLENLGYAAPFREVSGRQTLAAFIDDCSGKRPIIVAVTGHYVAIDRTTFIDTKTKGKPVSLKDAPGRRTRVNGYFDIRHVSELYDHRG